jgi:putative salt-induced outer membrane protein YdiY
MAALTERLVAAALGVAVMLQASLALADEVLLKNGDRITGKIVSATGGKMVVAPDFAKGTTITLSQDDVATFSSSGPITLRLADGAVTRQPVSKADPGAVQLAPEGGAAPQAVGLAEIKEINPTVPHAKWVGTASLNGSYARAETDTMTLGGAFDGTRTTEQDRFAFSGAYNYGRQRVDGLSSANANNWFAQGKYDYFFSPKFYGFGLTRVEADRVNLLKLRFSPGGGVGYQWVNRDSLHFNTDAGVSWIYEDYLNKPESDRNISIRLAYHLDKAWQQGRIKVYNDLALIPSLEDQSKFLAQADAGLRVGLVGSMFTELKVNVTYDNRPDPGARDFTSQVLIGLGVSY